LFDTVLLVPISRKRNSSGGDAGYPPVQNVILCAWKLAGTVVWEREINGDDNPKQNDENGDDNPKKNENGDDNPKQEENGDDN
jgi:hypothetical protein